MIAGIGRSWVDEILWSARALAVQARRRPRRRRSSSALAAAIVADARRARSSTTSASIELPIPDKLPMPLAVHRHEGEPCPRCGTTLAAVNYEDYVMSYCPACQTEGRVLKDRRLSRLLK